MSIDVTANRAGRKWSRGELLGRILWSAAQPAFRFSPRICWGWRRAILRAFGARIGRQVHVHPSVRITIPWNVAIGDETAVGDDVILYGLGPIRIGARSTISQGAHLCAGTHDHRRRDFPLVKAPITVGDDVWICADAFIGPSVEIGDRAIVAARSVIMKPVAADTIVRSHGELHVQPRPSPV